jgi:dephospho-CoA kinase
LIVGLVGGIASGKSLCARMLAAKSGRVIDADEIVKNLQQDPAVVAEMERILGAPVRSPDGSLDRAAAAGITFATAGKREALEKYLHPLVRKRIEIEVAECNHAFAASGLPELVILDVPLLFEAGLIDRCDRVVFVESRPADREARALVNRSWNAKEVRRRESHQSDLNAKRARADYRIRNDGTLADLEAHTAAVLAKLTSDFHALQAAP